MLKKRKQNSKRIVRKARIKINRKRILTGLIIIILMIGVVITAMQTSFYGVAIGVITGFLISYLMNNL